MTKDEIQSIRENLREILDELDTLDELETWDKASSRRAGDCLSDFSYYTERQKMYYKQYRGFMKD